MKLLKYLIPLAMLTTGLLLNTQLSLATAEYTKKEKKPCTACHVSAKSKELNDAGKYYEKHKTLDGYKAPEKK
ncbi:MAG: hypothetical protein FJW20_01695 [Acidimicrobiia bacterium]|nr:hypothetical protein [Acidimicrobiia bacterium]